MLSKMTEQFYILLQEGFGNFARYATKFSARLNVLQESFSVRLFGKLWLLMPNSATLFLKQNLSDINYGRINSMSWIDII